MTIKITDFTPAEIASAIDAEARGWAEFYNVTEPAEIEDRRNVMRANVAVGFVTGDLAECLLDAAEARQVREAEAAREACAAQDLYEARSEWLDEIEINGPQPGVFGMSFAIDDDCPF